MKTSLAPSITTRDSKGLKFMSIVEAAYNKAGLFEDEAQRVNEAPGLSELVSNFVNENRTTNRFSNEEMSSKYGYLSGYKPKGITEQTNILRQLISGIGFADEKLALRPLPENAEGWFAIPKWQSVAPTYGEAVQKVLDLIKKTRDGMFYSYCEGKLGRRISANPKSRRRYSRSSAKSRKITTSSLFRPSSAFFTEAVRSAGRLKS